MLKTLKDAICKRNLVFKINALKVFWHLSDKSCRTSTSTLTTTTTTTATTTTNKFFSETNSIGK